ncbi:hypothetical protein N7468_000951 [Penicillium chermesinum]|uniref:Calponin-homology (CH) domain-containing protein n=1 Tax=Penicillium chermesinum TaxID=63820 RepID=A0A9W9PHW8_9EURO|nr:uncharacterized protein N7468_000951 [Penicillium chermesinum]KAJ5245968.1 hypothetical protein N7468_000951 [Penicillium chermesinum]
MSGILGEAVTPCPSRSRSSGFRSDSETLDSFLNEDTDYEPTGQIEYTTEIKAPTLKSSRPRRVNRVRSVFQIHEDVGEKPGGIVEKRRRETGSISAPANRKSSLLAQPAQRFRPKVNFAPDFPRTAKEKTETQSKPVKSVTNTIRGAVSAKSRDSGEQSSPQSLVQTLKKDVRRNTVYIPPDDTTIASAFMELFSPMKKDVSLQQTSDETQTNTLEAQIARRKYTPGSFFDLDCKINTKKEVFPRPGVIPISASKPVRQNATRQLTIPKSTDFGVAAKHPSPKRAALSDKKNLLQVSPCSVRHKSDDNDVTSSKKAVHSATFNARASALAERLGRTSLSNASKTGRHGFLKMNELNREYPKLAEDISKPALYADDWLSHQETVIAQLCNSLFEYTSGESSFQDQSTLRLELLEIYHTKYFVQLHQKIQASLSCGTLSMSKETLIRNNRLRRDVGLRRKFLDLWIKSYDLRALTAALETVIGRQVSNDPYLFGTNTLGSPESPGRRKRVIAKKLEGFLDTFLLRNDDLGEMLPAHKDSADAQAKAYHRTVLRCIMLIVLLDKGKQSPHSSFPRKLFTPTSNFKSSIEVLQAVTRLLLPSLLFFSPRHMQSDLEDQTVTLNTGEALSLLGGEADVPLSKHLKYPCMSRAAKIFNVQVALSALRSVNGSCAIVENVRAEEIVDGYREKTISLLWALVSKWGLAGLVDWEDLNKEIARLKRKAVSQLGPVVEDQDWFTGIGLNEPDDHTRDLHQWAAILSALKNISISNMTTCFSDGKIYESIVDEYQPYITGTSHTQNTMSLSSRLRLLGCDYQFAQLVSPGTESPILDRDFTFGALAFLCSRLLSASKNARAATILQRAWRARLAARDDARRTIAKSLAEHCAAVVQTRNEILWAKAVIARWWRQVQSRRERQAARRQPTRKRSRQPTGCL